METARLAHQHTHVVLKQGGSLYSYSIPIHQAAKSPVVGYKQENSDVEKTNGDGVVEEPQDEDGVHPVGGAAKKHEQKCR